MTSYVVDLLRKKCEKVKKRKDEIHGKMTSLRGRAERSILLIVFVYILSPRLLHFCYFFTTAIYAF